MEHKIDKSLKNAHGKPIYPRLVTAPNGERVRVFNTEHEAEVTGTVGKKEEKKEEIKKEEKKEETKQPELPPVQVEPLRDPAKAWK